MNILTCEQMKNAEKTANEQGLTYLKMMENAGRGCYEKIRRNIDLKSKKICVVCGKGNNGGDGFVIAGLFQNDGFDVTVALAFGEPKSDTAKDVYERLIQTGCTIYDCEKDSRLVSSALKSADVIVDAVFGTGFSGNVDGKTLKMFELINNLKSPVFSVDVPSGISGDSGEVGTTAINADFTLAVCAYKPCHIFYPARELCGVIKRVNIGIDNEIIEKAGELPYYSLTLNEIKSKFTKRSPLSNKGDYGKVLEICASKRMPGAAVLCAKGVLRSGAGLLRIAFPDEAYCAIAPQVTEATMYPLKSDSKGFFDKCDVDRILKAVEWADVVVIGCGLGVTDDTVKIVCDVIRESKVPVVIDADGINAVAKNINILRTAQAPIVLTPHPGEMSRLTGKSVEEIQKDRLHSVKEFVSKHNVTVVLKGANTVVGVPEERSVYVNTTGNAGMATGGSGDLLAGITAGFLAQKMSVRDASVCAAFVHGMAGDIASKEKSKMSCLPSDVAEKIPNVLLNMEE